MKLDHHYWDEAVENRDLHYSDSPIWAYKKRELICLIKKWGDLRYEKRILKTDLMEEALRSDHLLFWLAEENRNIFGMDISPKIVKSACKRYNSDGNKINFVVSDVKKLSFQDASFDLIISNSTLDHFPEIDLALKELYRILRPQGVLIITLNNKLEFSLNLYLLFKKIFKPNQEHYFGRCYSMSEAIKRLKEAGFRIQDSTTLMHIPIAVWLLAKFIQDILKINTSLNQRERMIHYLERLGSKNTILNYFTGMFIALKALK